MPRIRNSKITFAGALCAANALSITGQEIAKTPMPFEKRYSLEQVSHLPTDERIATLEKLLKAKPTDVQVELALGSAFLQKMRETTDFQYMRRAEALDETALSQNSDSYEAERLSIEIDMHKHDFPKAAESARVLLQSNPTDTGMLGLLGDALMEMGKCNEAGEIYKRMASLGGNLFSFNRLAFHQFVTGDMKGALAWMGAAVAAGSPYKENQAWVQCELGDLLSKEGRFDDAEVAYQSALEVFPRYHRAEAGLGALQASQGKFLAAIQRFERAQAVVPFPQYAAMLEALYEHIGKTEAASGERSLVDAVDKLMPSNGETANRALVLIYADTGRNLAHALHLAQNEFAVRDDVYSWDALSWALLKNNRLQEASEASRRALIYQTPEPMFYYHAGMIAAAVGDESRARMLLERVLAVNPVFDFRYAPIARLQLQKLNRTPAN